MTALALAGLAAVLCAALIVVLRPLLLRYALARPNARSSHWVPTPQGGGIAVVAAALVALWVGWFFSPVDTRELAVVSLAALLLAGVGVIDDIRPLPASLRLVLQGAAVAAVVAVVPVRLLPEAVPLWLERGICVFAGLWFVNLVNFMDGLDWMTVAEVVPVAGGLLLFGALGLAPWSVVLASAALLGATLGFAPFNKPVARLFLGDVGSLPIGLLLAWMLYRLAGSACLVPALLLPLYYIADATLTLLRRLARRERVWEAHRTHFYQRATDNGFSVIAVDAHVFGLNLALVLLAGAAAFRPYPVVQAGALVAGCGLVGWVLARFAARVRP